MRSFRLEEGSSGDRQLDEYAEHPPEQVRRCKAAFVRPKLEEVLRLASIAGLDVEAVTVEDDRIFVSNSSEEQRYFLQHSLNFQVHDRAHPHTPGRHGRAEIGWTT